MKINKTAMKVLAGVGFTGTVFVTGFVSGVAGLAASVGTKELGRLLAERSMNSYLPKSEYSPYPKYNAKPRRPYYLNEFDALGYAKTAVTNFCRDTHQVLPGTKFEEPVLENDEANKKTVDGWSFVFRSGVDHELYKVSVSQLEGRNIWVQVWAITEPETEAPTKIDAEAYREYNHICTLFDNNQSVAGISVKLGIPTEKVEALVLAHLSSTITDMAIQGTDPEMIAEKVRLTMEVMDLRKNREALQVLKEKLIENVQTERGKNRIAISLQAIMDHALVQMPSRQKPVEPKFLEYVERDLEWATSFKDASVDYDCYFTVVQKTDSKRRVKKTSVEPKLFIDWDTL